MFRRLQTAADIALGAAVSGWRRARGSARRYAEQGRESRSRLGERVSRETDAWRESSREQWHSVEDRVREELERALRRAHVVTRGDQAALSRQLRQLQARVANLEAQLAREGGEADGEARQ
jgi:BMFP domain-containing protein YqiC